MNKKDEITTPAMATATHDWKKQQMDMYVTMKQGCSNHCGSLDIDGFHSVVIQFY